jgi:beta-glucanase (GH16 family)
METGYGDNGWGNNEWQLYTSDTSSENNNARVENGDLIITARCSGTQAECANGATADKSGLITSARLISENKFDVKYGNIQARIKPPPGKGTWPAFWMLGTIISNLNWPAAGEIDIMEMHQFFSNDRTTHFTVHYCDESLLPATDRNTVNDCFVNGGRVFDSRFLEFDLPLTSDYHIFELDWDQERIIGKIDGVTYYSRPIDPETEEEFLRSFFLLLNVAVGGDLGGPPSVDTTWPQEMRVDWIRVYKKDVASAGLLEVVPEDPTQPLPFQRTINSAEFGGDSVVTDLTSTAVTPLFGDTVIEFDYRTGNTFFSGAAFNFLNVDLRNFNVFEFSLDRSLFTALEDIGVEISDERFDGGAVGRVNVPLSNYEPVSSEGNWDTYQIPMSDFNGVDLENVVNVGFWNPVDNSSPPRLVAGKLYADGIKFKREKCTTEASVAFDSDFYNPETNVASVTINDICNASRTAVVKVESDTGAIGVGVKLDATGAGTTNFNLAKPNSVCSTDDTLQILKLSADNIPLTATYSRTDIITDGGMQTVTFTDVAGIDENAPGTSIIGEKKYFYATDPNQPITFLPDNDFQISPFGSNSTFDGAFPDSTFNPSFAVTSGAGYGGANAIAQLIFFDGGGDPPVYPGFAGFAEGAETFNFKIKNLPSNNLVTVGLGVLDESVDNYPVDVTTSEYSTFIGDGWYDVRLPMSLFPNDANYDYIIWDAGIGTPEEFTFLITDIFLQDAASTLPAECEQEVTDPPPPGGTPNPETIGVYSETNTDPVLPYSAIINSADFSGNQTVADEGSTTVTPFDGTVSLEIDFQDSGQSFGGSIFDIGGGDVSEYLTLKFAIDTTGMPSFADLVIQPEDGSNPVESVFLSNYPAVYTTGSWSIHEIPLSVFPNLDTTNLTLLGFWNASDTQGVVSLTYGQLYLDDIHFSKLPLSIGVYAEEKTNPVLSYSGIINSIDFSGNNTPVDESSTDVTPFEGNVSLEIDYQNSGQSFGGALLNFGGADISGYNTLRFAIDTSAMPSFADLVIQPEDGSNPVESVFLSAYPPVRTVGNWSVHEIPLSAFPNLDKSNLTLLGFWNASSSEGSVTLTYGQIYLDDIRFYE